MKTTFLKVGVLLYSLNLFAQQETCKSSDQSLLDVNSITKCSIEPVKKTSSNKQIKVKVLAKKRFLRKRVRHMNNPHTSGLSSVQLPVVELEKKKINPPKTLGQSFKSLSERLSKNEITKAIKLYYVDKIPSFKQCRNVKREEELDCFNQEMVKHINKHFRYPLEAVRDQIQGEVWVRFIIDKEGYITNVKTLGPDGGEILMDEAQRVVSKLSHFKPGKHQGKFVSVKYGFPINFSIEE